MPLEDRDVTRLTDMLHHARLALEVMGARTLEGFKAEVVIQLAVVRCIEVIGEAGHQVTPAVQLALPMISWHLMWNMRNRLIHDYGHTDLRVVHDVVTGDLLVLVAQLEAFLAQHRPAPGPTA